MGNALNDAPLNTTEALDLFGCLTPAPGHGGATFAVAVSGGSDSMALAWCAKQWADRCGKKVIALIVDHALRPESGAEAVTVKQRLADIGIAGVILTWHHGPVTHKIHEQARTARYDLLRSACKARQINDLLLGHHRDDQAETILMRLSKGSGIEGLAGMAVESWRGDMRLLRPFLHLDKSRLIATCHAAGLVFIDDPSNQSEKFARGRLRKIMPLLAAEGLTVESLMGLGARAAEANDALEAMTDTVMGRAVCFHTGGDIVVDRAEMLAAPRAIALRVLARCLRQINGGDYPPERAGLLALLDALNGRDGQIGSLAVQKKNSQEELVGLPNNPKLTRTFYGCLIVGRAKDIHILREAAAATEETAFVTDTLLRWDGRWEIFGRVAGLTSENLTLRALGHPPHDILDQLAPRLRRQIPQGRVRASLPALWNGNQLCAVPSFDTSAGLWMRRVKKSYTVFI